MTTPTPKVANYTGRVSYIFAYDVAYDTRRQPVATLLGLPVEQFSLDASKRMPREMLFARPQMVTLPPVQKAGPHGPVEVHQTVKVFSVGAISIAISVPFSVQHVEDLVSFHGLRLDGEPLNEYALKLAERAKRELGDYFVRPVAQLRDEEAYTVFCIHAPMLSAGGQAIDAEDWLAAHRRSVAALLTEEPDQGNLSDQETDESTGRHLSYYQQDLAVIDWDAALVIDTPDSYPQVLHVMELANVQLAELEAYDRTLDDSMDRSYRDLRQKGVRPRGDVLSELRDIRIDMARLSDELGNITKFFGDWHLARAYQHLSARFHLADWQKTVDEKLKTLDELYSILKQDQNTRLMLWLEVMVVVLFVIDLVVLVLELLK